MSCLDASVSNESNINHNDDGDDYNNNNNNIDNNNLNSMQVSLKTVFPTFPSRLSSIHLILVRYSEDNFSILFRTLDCLLKC